jgi:hypothetical protein
MLVRRRGLEPLCLAAQAPQACASANFATSALGQPTKYTKNGEGHSWRIEPRLKTCPSQRGSAVAPFCRRKSVSRQCSGQRKGRAGDCHVLLPFQLLQRRTRKDRLYLKHKSRVSVSKQTKLELKSSLSFLIVCVVIVCVVIASMRPYLDPGAACYRLP